MNTKKNGGSQVKRLTIAELKDLVIWAKEQEICHLSVDGFEIAFCDGIFKREAVFPVDPMPVRTKEEIQKEEDDLLFYSS